MFAFECLTYDFIFLTLCLLSFLYYYITRNNDYWKNRGVAYDSPVPFFGNIKNVVLLKSSLGEELEKLYKKYPNNDLVGIFMFRSPDIILRDPALIKNVLIKDFNKFRNRGKPSVVDPKKEPLHAHLFSLNGTEWRNLRSTLTPTFTSGKLRQMFHLLVECGEEFQKYVTKIANQKEPVEVKEICANYTMDVIGSCAFGIKINSMKNDSTFRKMGRKIFETNTIQIYKRFFKFVSPRLFRFLGLRSGSQEIDDFFIGIVRGIITHREETNEVRHDFMQSMIQLKNRGYVDSVHEKNEIVFDENMIATQVAVFFAAGYETSSSVMSFCLYELALHPDIQDKVREEIDNTLKKHDGKLTYEGVQEMQYLDKVISETIRKYPTAPAIIRQCSADYTIPGTNTVIENGTMVFIPVQALHYDPQYYPEPDRFDPERFSEENKKSRPQMVYLPFGEGPRNCIGMRLGKFQTTIGLVSFLSTFQVKPCAKTSIPIEFDIGTMVNSSKTGIWLEVDHRSKLLD